MGTMTVARKADGFDLRGELGDADTAFECFMHGIRTTYGLESIKLVGSPEAGGSITGIDDVGSQHYIGGVGPSSETGEYAQSFQLHQPDKVDYVRSRMIAALTRAEINTTSC